MAGNTEISFRKAGVEDIEGIRACAREAWFVAYPSIISIEQIEGMLGLMYSAEQLRREISDTNNYTYLLATIEGNVVGFCGLGPHSSDKTVARLNKLYLKPDLKGSGLGSKILRMALHLNRFKGFAETELNVNKRNPAVDFYLKHNFYRYQEVVLNFHGWIMDDYLLRYRH